MTNFRVQNLDPGRVRVRLTCEGGRVSAIQVSSERPDVARLLRGRAADQAMQVIPSLFALCGEAQTRAAALALAAARGEGCPVQMDSAVQREALREHLWRCLLDLPILLGEAALHREFVSAVKCVTDGKRGDLRALLASPPVGALCEMLRQGGGPPSSAPHVLPPLDAKNSLAEWPRLSAEFCRRPNWRGKAAETGAIARQMSVVHQAPTGEEPVTLLSTRWLARFDELLDWTTGNLRAGAIGTVSAAPVAPGVGRAIVETARGMLMHEITLHGDRIADYLIAAPTEWNCHPQGAMADHLLGQDAVDRDALRRHVTKTVAALDPCVPFELEWA